MLGAVSTLPLSFVLPKFCQDSYYNGNLQVKLHSNKFFTDSRKIEILNDFFLFF